MTGTMVTWELVTEQRRAEFESQKMDAMITNAPINIILADKDLKITYANPATVKSLQPLAHLLPVPLDRVVGSSVDIFHKDPTHQRRILANYKTFPHTAHIKLGENTLNLLVSAIYDKKGDYLGPMVTWENITERLAMEERQRQMQKEAQDKAQELQDKVSQLLVTVKAAAGGDLTALVTVKARRRHRATRRGSGADDQRPQERHQPDRRVSPAVRRGRSGRLRGIGFSVGRRAVAVSQRGGDVRLDPGAEQDDRGCGDER